MLWLTGVDYFSTLGYQPGIALLAAGAIAPLATTVLVLVTLFGALPIYREVARRSYLGHGSISMLENLLPGWPGKLFVLALLGFATTDFVITMTLSAADAATHAVENPFLEHWLHGHEMGLTIGMLALLALVFLVGFREAIGLATWIAVPYLVLNTLVVGRSLWEVAHHPEAWANWERSLEMRGSWTALMVASIFAFPKLALGLSGFETGVTVMPLVEGTPPDPTHPPHLPGGPPTGRIRAAGRMLTAAALIMSALLIGSSVSTTVLIPEAEWREGGAASGRALAWLAHTYFGDVFGTIYDASTILILWFAGASAMAALLTLIPRYLPRFGMAPHWVSFSRPLILLLFLIDVVVTWVFDADVEAQGGAYATGVLALMLSAAVAVTLALRQEARAERVPPWRALPFALITAVFAFTLVDNVIERPDGLIISSIFIGAIVTLGAVSRFRRATELRVERLEFLNPESKELWEEMRPRKVHFVTVKHTDTVYARVKARLRRHYALKGPIAFLHVELAKDRSQFDTPVQLRVQRLGDDFRITVYNAVAVANTIAYLSEQLDPISIILGLTRENPMTQAFRYLLWGEGETGILVYQILLKHWRRSPEDDLRPNIYLMSD
ncbi:MAG: hypothetical protein Q8P18_10705 [Pseudomonadota bacterium]|nr:hypothetical protein [Pseudomonadota bacterium]